MPDDSTRVIQVSNLSPTVTKDQMKSLFGFIGKIDEICLYPEESTDVLSRVCFVRFRDSEDVGVSLHLTNTVFVDRPLIVVPFHDGRIPEESAALGLIISPDAHDPGTMYSGLTQYPALPASTELSKVEEIRRTVYVSNIDSAVSAEALMQFFGLPGEVKYIRMAGDEMQVTRSAFVEYSDQVSVVKALSLNGQLLAGRPVRVTPSNNAIAKLVAPGLNATSREIKEAMRKVNEAQPLIAAAVDPDANGHRSRSRSSRHHSSRSRRSRSKHRSRSKRSRSCRRSRSRSYKGSRPKRCSRSRSRKRSRSPRRRRSRTKSRDRKKHRSRSCTPCPAKSRRSGSRSKRKRSDSGSREKARDKTSKKSKSRSRSLSVPKLEKEGRSASEQENKEHSSKKRKLDPEELNSKRESSSRKSKSPKRSPRKGRSKSKSPKSSTRKEKIYDSSHDTDRKASDHDKAREREKDRERDNRRDKDRESCREKNRSPEKRHESGKDQDDRRDGSRSRERNRSRERRSGGDRKSSQHRHDKKLEYDAEDKPGKMKRYYDEKCFTSGVPQEKPGDSAVGSEEEQEQHPSCRHYEGAAVDTVLTQMDMDIDSE